MLVFARTRDPSGPRGGRWVSGAVSPHERSARTTLIRLPIAHSEPPRVAWSDVT
jgi:hypothetical protein